MGVHKYVSFIYINEFPFCLVSHLIGQSQAFVMPRMYKNVNLFVIVDCGNPWLDLELFVEIVAL